MFIESIDQISKEKLTGKVIAFPTDTVFGIGAKIDDSAGISKIYQLKKRDLHKPLVILASKVEDILPYIERPTDKVIDIMKKYWPGALTIIFQKKKSIHLILNNDIDTIAFRIPNSSIALSILEKTGPLATTSVNISGDKPINTYQEIADCFGDTIDYLFCKNVSSSKVSSTIIDATSNEIKIIRNGEIKIYNK